MTLTPEDDKQWLLHIAKSWFSVWLKRKVNQEEDNMDVITADERKLIAELLRLASESFSNHGCNDFDLREHGLEHMASDLNKLLWEGQEEELEVNKNKPVVEDWLLMRILANKLDPR